MQVGCKLSLVVFQYCTMANFYWLLVEGLYLHTLLVAVLGPRRHLLAYLLIGWGKDAAAHCVPPVPRPPMNLQVPVPSHWEGLVQGDGRACGQAPMAPDPWAQ